PACSHGDASGIATMLCPPAYPATTMPADVAISDAPLSSPALMGPLQLAPSSQVLSTKITGPFATVMVWLSHSTSSFSQAMTGLAVSPPPSAFRSAVGYCTFGPKVFPESLLIAMKTSSAGPPSPATASSQATATLPLGETAPVGLFLPRLIGTASA